VDRNIRLAACLAVVLSCAAGLHAQGGFSIRAAAADPVAGWQKMDIGNRSVWVSPTPSLTSADIARAQQTTDPNGGTAVAIVLTDAGEKKMRELSSAQMNKLIAMVLDGKVVFAPTVRSEIGKQALITGSGPSGLTSEDARRIVASVTPK
jgi:preprotein translocase subunit SecD